MSGQLLHMIIILAHRCLSLRMLSARNSNESTNAARLQASLTNSISHPVMFQGMKGRKEGGGVGNGGGSAKLTMCIFQCFKTFSFSETSNIYEHNSSI